MTERRQYFRRRTLLNGRLEVEKLNGWVLDCTVRNVSEGGARLALPTHVVVPQTLSLSISDGAKRPATLVWYHEGHAGFALDERRAATRLVPANDRAPKRDGETSRLAARVAAIACRNRPRPHFTGL